MKKALCYVALFGAGMLVGCLGLLDIAYRNGYADPERMSVGILNSEINHTAVALLMMLVGFYTAFAGLWNMFESISNHRS